MQDEWAAVDHLVYKHGEKRQYERPYERAELRVEKPCYSSSLCPMPARQRCFQASNSVNVLK